MRKLYTIFGIILLIALVCLPNISIEGAQKGIEMCLGVVVPSLLPFFICSRLLINLGFVHVLGRYTGWLMKPLFKVPGSGSLAFCLGLLSGYPVGAKSAVSLYEQGLCSKNEAQRLVSFCNNSGPLFIIGAVGVGMYGSPSVGYMLYGIHALSAVTLGILLGFFGKSRADSAQVNRTPIRLVSIGNAFTDAVKDSVVSMGIVCGYIVCFSVIISIAQGLGLISYASALLCSIGFSKLAAQGIIMGFCEISRGISTLGGDVTLLPVTSLLLAWSGVSVLLQVAGIISKYRLSVKYFVLSKLVQGIIAYIFTLLLLKF